MLKSPPLVATLSDSMRMSPCSWGDIFTWPLRGDRIIGLRHCRASRVDKGLAAGQNEKASHHEAPVCTGSLPHARARVAELADALRSGRSDRKVVEVRVLSRAPILEKPAALFVQMEIPPCASTREALLSCRSGRGTNGRSPNRPSTRNTGLVDLAHPGA